MNIPTEENRITPAYAGNTHQRQRRVQRMRDHPRIRGEHRIAPAHSALLQGSPPHTRGTRRAYSLVCGRRRITPAYAGNTARYTRRGRCIRDPPRIRGEHPPLTTSSLPSWDHPRIRGEHFYAPSLYSVCPGSPPHTRGTLKSHLNGL